jgi:hypothetical protein
MRTYEQRRDDVATAAWEIWTNNGLRLDEDEREQTGKSVNDAVANAYQDGVNDAQWLRLTLDRLGAP